jgi:endoglucanase
VVTVVATVLSPLLFGLGVQVLPHSGRVGGEQAAVRAPKAASPSPRGATLWVNPENPAAQAVRTTQTVRPADAVLLRRIAARPQSVWIGSGFSPAAATSFVSQRAAAAGRSATVPVFVVYAIPARDCGQYSRGGTKDPAGYRALVDGVAEGLAGRRAVVVLEPDALAQLDCLTAAQQKDRLALLRYAVATLGGNRRLSVYLDAGHAYWEPAAEMARRLRGAGVDRARGISLNVANFDTTDSEIAYGKAIGKALGRRVPLVVDTSRNGNGRWDGPERWCNPPGRALGQRPTTNHPDRTVDALLWIKTPGLSDGTCRGGPNAGQW